jgi:hypothetical protein
MVSAIDIIHTNRYIYIIYILHIIKYIITHISLMHPTVQPGTIQIINRYQRASKLWVKMYILNMIEFFFIKSSNGWKVCIQILTIDYRYLNWFILILRGKLSTYWYRHLTLKWTVLYTQIYEYTDAQIH